jgi:uncharacterized membrane protein
MKTIEKSIEVDAPVERVYDEWTHFEEFPRFMEGVEKVTRTDRTHLHWVARIAGKPQEWDAEITENVPDERISWRSTRGARNAGSVMFQPRAGHTMITLRLDYEPRGAMEMAGDAMGLVSRRVENDLQRFAKHIQEHITSTGSSANQMRQAASDSGMGPEYDSSGNSGLR